MRKIELLAPAKNLQAGMAAICHGADAVYIGASHHGARAAAGNSIDDIAQLCAYAHSYQARVYVTLNTLVYDNELEAVRQLLRQLAQIHVDAVLVQDMAIVDMVASCPDDDGMAWLRGRLHASTQTDNRTPEKVAWLHSVGFSRVVLARELSLDEIRAIHERTPGVELEAFVHGALCVSYSGQCYASQYCFHRSANRGECAQFCRMKFSLTDNDGMVIERDLHLLSLKDMCQASHLEQLLEAGVVSLKIEGRLKDAAYVKNVVAAYSQRLDDIIARHPGRYCRSSLGHCTYAFTPNLEKTFNRGYTSYFLNGRVPDISSPATPKAIGQYVGKVKAVGGGSFTVAGIEAFANGDGLCFINADGQLEGFRVNRVAGNRIFPLAIPAGLKPGTALYRNNDKQFEDQLDNPKSAERRIDISMRLSITQQGVALKVQSEGGHQAMASIDIEHQAANKPQRDNMVRQLGKVGATRYRCRRIDIDDDAQHLFVPSSRLSELRRGALEQMDNVIAHASDGPAPAAAKDIGANRHDPCLAPTFYGSQTFLYNISNHVAKAFYARHGLQQADAAFELKVPAQPLVMQCRYCLRYALGRCVKHGGQQPTWREPLHLTLGDGRRFRLQFHCSTCQMNIYAEE